jgi:TPR repeat protein
MGISLASGSVFARDYRVLRPLNEGGMGAVYVVEQLSTGSQRALKLMHPQFVQDPRSRQRFEQEARVGARIESEHVVQVLAAGVDDATGYPYIVMELLKGEDLAAALHRRGALTPPEVGHIFAQLCHALAAAHAAGVVHRDLKPENIFLAESHREGATFVVKVLDFGIAKVVAEAKTSSTAAIGTPLWMAPEQTSLHSNVGPPTDVWALGLIAFRMLTGRVYWAAANDEGASTAALMREILFEPVIPASERAAQYGVAASLPPGFDAWFGRCVHREMGARFANAAEARAALATVLGGFTPAPPGAQPMPVATPAPGPVAQTPPPGATIPGVPFGMPSAGPPTPAPGATTPHPFTPPPEAVAPPAAAPQMPYGAPPPGAITPPGTAFGSTGGARPQAAPAKRGNGAIAGIGAAVVVLGGLAFGVLKMRAAHDRSACQESATTVTAANAASVADTCGRACSDRGGESCVLRGEIVQRFKVGEAPADAARKAFEKACDAGEARGCRRAAALLDRKEPSKAAEFYTKACDRGDAPACAGLGALSEQGSGISRDRMRALSLYDKACQAGDPLGCAYQSFMLGAGRGIKQDAARAAELAKTAQAGLGPACERGEARECVALAALISSDGAGDTARAAQLEQQACEGGEPAGCANLGVRTLLGAGVFKDPKRGAALLRQACDAGEATACADLGVLAARAAFGLRREVRGVSALKLACDGIYSVGCSGWGTVYPAPTDVPLDAAAAVELSTRACDAGELIGCVNAGAFFQYGVGTARNREKATELFKKACEAGDAGGCGELGTMHATGRGVPFDGKRGMELFQQACDWGEQDSCAVMGDMKVSGIGVPKAPEEGAAVFKTYCDKHGLAMACHAYAGLVLQGRGVKKDPAGAVAMLKPICEGKKDRPYPTACATLGGIYENALAGARDLPAAARYYQMACDVGTPAGCIGLARLYEGGLGVPKDQAKARSLVEAGCKGGDAGACDQLGYFHTMGKAGLKADGNQGIKFFQEACDDASWGSCANIGYIHLLGLAGVPKDKAKAAEYLKLACSHADDGACQKMKENGM